MIAQFVAAAEINWLRPWGKPLCRQLRSSRFPAAMCWATQSQAPSYPLIVSVSLYGSL